MSTLKIGRNHKARKALFTRGIRRGFLTVAEIDDALPSGALTDAERWLLYYSLHAARVEVRDVRGRPVDVEAMRPAGAEVEGFEEAEEPAEAAFAEDDEPRDEEASDEASWESEAPFEH